MQFFLAFFLIEESRFVFNINNKYFLSSKSASFLKVRVTEHWSNDTENSVQKIKWVKSEH